MAKSNFRTQEEKDEAIRKHKETNPKDEKHKQELKDLEDSKVTEEPL